MVSYSALWPNTVGISGGLFRESTLFRSGFPIIPSGVIYPGSNKFWSAVFTGDKSEAIAISRTSPQ